MRALNLPHWLYYSQRAAAATAMISPTASLDPCAKGSAVWAASATPAGRAKPKKVLFISADSFLGVTESEKETFFKFLLAMKFKFSLILADEDRELHKTQTTLELLKHLGKIPLNDTLTFIKNTGIPRTQAIYLTNAHVRELVACFQAPVIDGRHDDSKNLLQQIYRYSGIGSEDKALVDKAHRFVALSEHSNLTDLFHKLILEGETAVPVVIKTFEACCEDTPESTKTEFLKVFFEGLAELSASPSLPSRHKAFIALATAFS